MDSQKDVLKRDTEAGRELAVLPVTTGDPDSITLSLYDIVAVLKRRKQLIGYLYLTIVLGCVLFCFFWPPTYEATVSFLVKRDPSRPVLSSDAYNAEVLSHAEVSEDDLNSEASVMSSSAVLEKTVQDLQLQTLPEHWALRLLNKPFMWTRSLYDWYHHKPDVTPVEKTVARLDSKLVITPQKKSAIIEMKVLWGDPRMAQKILEQVEENYLAQHAALNRNSGNTAFYQSLIQQKEQEVADIEKQMEAIQPGASTGAVKLEQELALKEAADFEAEWRKARASSAQLDARIQAHTNEIKTVPDQVVIENKPVINQMALENLENRVLELQLQKTELLQKYTPDHLLVKHVEEELAQAQAMLAQEKSAFLQEKTTGVNRVAQSLQEDYSLNRVSLSGDRALSQDMKKEYEAYQHRIKGLTDKELALADLDRKLHAAEENLNLYRRDVEDAEAQERWNEARIVNVVPIAPARSNPNPVKPNTPMAIKLALSAGLLFALGFAFAVEGIQDRFYSARDVERHLKLPVLASLDRHSRKSTSGSPEDSPKPSTGTA